MAVLDRVKAVPPRQFAAFRIALGAYLALHFAMLVPYASECIGAQGLVPDPAANFTGGLLPNPLEWVAAPWFPAAFLALLAALALCFAAGFYRRATAVALWFGWACLFNRNNLIANPSIPYIGLLLLLCAAVPSGEPWSLRPKKTPGAWFFPAWAWRAAWILMAAGYTFSGLDKYLQSPSWLDGSALSHILHLPLARPGPVRSALLALPGEALSVLTWSALALEMAFLPLSLHRRTRPWAWTAMVAMHLGILSTLAFADLVVGMLLLHAFTFDPEWLAPFRTAPASKLAVRTPQPILFFDGSCGLCHRFVRLVLRAYRGGALRFAPLCGTTALALLPPAHSGRDASSMLFLDERGLHERSDAALAVFRRIGGPWRVLGWTRVVPRILRDGVYRMVANNRYAILGRADQCELANESQRARLLP